MNQMTTRDMQQHVPIVGWLLLAQSALYLIVAAFIFLLLTGIGVSVDDPQARQVLPAVGGAIAVVMIVIALPGLLAGYGLLKRQPWGRILAIIVVIPGLVSFPLGTALGIYTLWVLLQPAAREYFAPPAPARLT